MTYSGKKDITYAIAIWSGPFLLLFLLLLRVDFTIITIIVLSFLLSFWIWNSTKYSIEGEILNIKCWILHKKLNIKNIRRIKNVKNIYSSYALAVDRLEINYNSNSKLYVSPLNQEEFIKEIVSINKEIQYDV